MLTGCESTNAKNPHRTTGTVSSTMREVKKIPVLRVGLLVMVIKENNTYQRNILGRCTTH